MKELDFPSFFTDARLDTNPWADLPSDLHKASDSSKASDQSKNLGKYSAHSHTLIYIVLI